MKRLHIWFNCSWFLLFVVHRNVFHLISIMQIGWQVCNFETSPGLYCSTLHCVEMCKGIMDRKLSLSTYCLVKNRIWAPVSHTLSLPWSAQTHHTIKVFFLAHQLASLQSAIKFNSWQQHLATERAKKPTLLTKFFHWQCDVHIQGRSSNLIFHKQRTQLAAN